MAEQTQQPEVAVAQRAAGKLGPLARQVTACGNQRGAGAVLQAAITLGHRVEQEDIAIERRCGVGMPESDLALADAARVDQQALAVKAWQSTGNDDFVVDVAGLEAAAPEIAQLDRVVDQLIVVSRLELQADAVRRDRHRGGHLPTGRQSPQAQAVRLGVAAVDPQAQAGAVEEASARIEKCSSHRVVKRIDPVADRERCAPCAVDAPAGLVKLLDRQVASALARRQPREMASELANHVAAGNPHRQGHKLRGIGSSHGQRDAEMVAVGIGNIDAVGNHSGSQRGSGSQEALGRCRQVPAAPRKQLSAATADKRNRSVSQCARPWVG